MRRMPAAAIALAATLIALPEPTAAQVPVRSFDQLNTRLKVGDTVYVTDAQGREIVGELRQLGPASMTVDAIERRTFGPQDIRLIEERPADSRKNGALWGLLIGAGAGVGVGALVANADHWTHEGEYGEDALIYGSIGAGAGAAVGAIIDGLRPGPRRVVFRTPGSQPGSARLSLAPVITPHTKGVAVSFAF